MKTQTIQQPERYEAPGIKVKVLRKRASMLLSGSVDYDPEGTIEPKHGTRE